MRSERIKIRSMVEVRKNGLLVARRPNLIMTAGLNRMAALMRDEAVSVIGYMAIGDDGTVSQQGMTALQGTEHERVAVTSARSGAIVTYTGNFGTGIVTDVQVAEFGLFDAAVAGTMIARMALEEIEMADDDDLEVKWSFTVGI